MTEHIDFHQFRRLAEKFIANTCTKEEFNLFLKEMEDENKKAELTAILEDLWEKNSPGDLKDQTDWNGKLNTMFREANYTAPVFELPTRKINRKRIVWAAAAAVLLIVSVLNYLKFSHWDRDTDHVVKTKAINRDAVNDIVPGKNIAVLTLSDGSTIILDSAKIGPLAQEGSTRVIKLASGQLSYKPGEDLAEKVTYNTISTPRGGQYEIVLADGTRVWLNAGSSLKFPTLFTGNKRNVYLTGEGYFEVAKNPAMPFNVMVQDMKVEVLGTHFNVNAYNDEKTIATTLLEGSVKVSSNTKKSAGSSILKKTGEQANFDKDGMIEITEIDIQEAISWKDGKFYFNNADISVLMRQIARWYDVEIKYEGEIPNRKFTGKIDRNVNVSEIVTMLEYAKVHVKVEGKTIVVAPY